MDQRLKLQTLLEGILGTKNVYFQPPRNIKMEYPAIVYSVDGLDTKFADNLPYNQKVEYQVTYIDRDPDNSVWRAIAARPLCSFNRTAVVDNLNHYYFTLYF